MLLASCKNSSANLDSLSKALDIADGFDRYTIYRLIGETHESARQFSSAKQNYWEGLQVCIDYGDSSCLSSSYTDLGVLFWHNSEFDSALHYLESARAIDILLKDTSSLAGSMLNIGVCNASCGRLPESIAYLEEAVVMYSSLEDDFHSRIAKHNLATAYKKVGLYDLSAKYEQEVLNDYLIQENSSMIGKSHNTLGNIYQLMGAFDKAIIHHRSSVNVKLANNDSSGAAVSYSNLGSDYRLSGQADTALIYYLKALEIKLALDEPNVVGIQTNIGQYFAEQGELQKAEDWLAKASLSISNLDDLQNEAILHNEYGRLRLAQRNFNAAEEALQKARDILFNIGDLESLRSNYELSVALNKKTGNLEAALQFGELLKAIEDSILNLQVHRAVTEHEIRYETQRIERESQEVKEENARQAAELQLKGLESERKTAVIIALISSSLLLLVIAIVTYKRFVDKRKSNDRIKMLMRELHHRVKNNLQVLSSILSLQGARLEDEKAREAVKRGEERVNAMMLIHRRLYVDEDDMDIQMKEYIESLLENLMHSYGYADDQITFRLDLEAITLDVDKAIPLGLIINEVVSNSFKYAYHSVSDPELLIRLKQIGSREISLFIKDNGPGLPTEVNLETKEEGFGMKLVKILSKQLKGELEQLSEKGLSYHLSFRN